MNKKKLEKYNKQQFIDLITKLNTKVVYLQRKKSQNGFKGKTMEYRANVCKDMVLKFLHKDIKHPLDECPSIKEVTMSEFRIRLNKHNNGT